MSTTSPVFIVGVPRSGTSRLYLALQAHERFRPTRSPGGFDLTESRVFLNPASIRERQGKAWDYLLHDEEEHAALVRSLPPAWTGRWRMPAVLRRQAERSRWARGVEWGICRNNAALRAFFTHAMRARGVQRWQAERFVVERSSSGLIHTDGETHAAGARVEFTVRPLSLRVLAPAAVTNC